MATAEDIKARLDPTHLTEEAPSPVSDDVLKKRVETATSPATVAEDPDKPNPKNEKSYTFQLNYKDARGKIWSGQFTTKILNIHERTQVGAARSIFAGGQPIQSLDAMTIEMNLIAAHLAYSLTEKPKWAENLRELDDPGVLQAIYDEVASHESHFLGWNAPESKG